VSSQFTAANITSPEDDVRLDDYQAIQFVGVVIVFEAALAVATQCSGFPRGRPEISAAGQVSRDRR
jgi:hypothetical protein